MIQGLAHALQPIKGDYSQRQACARTASLAHGNRRFMTLCFGRALTTGRVLSRTHGVWHRALCQRRDWASRAMSAHTSTVSRAYPTEPRVGVGVVVLRQLADGNPETLLIRRAKAPNRGAPGTVLRSRAMNLIKNLNQRGIIQREPPGCLAICSALPSISFSSRGVVLPRREPGAGRDPGPVRCARNARGNGAAAALPLARGGCCRNWPA